MSAKWIRSQQWDDRWLTGALTPVKVVLRLFSSIPLAILLLSLVCLFGVVASVPIGLLASIPSWILIGGSCALTIAVVALVPLWILDRTVLARAGKAGRFTAVLLGGIALAVLGAWLWRTFAWPRLRYDSVTGRGFMMFASFVNDYSRVTLRRMPGFEMTELEFYGWWPLRVILMLFVVNMVTATLRRIEFSFPNIGVLTVHTGIVIIAIGSMYYQSLKQEGDVLLRAGDPDDSGKLSVGPAEPGFLDNIDVVAWLDQGRGYEQRLIRRLPRYNEYNLRGAAAIPLPYDPAPYDQGRLLDIRLPDAPPPAKGRVARIDDDLSFRVVGYASYADLRRAWIPSKDLPADPAQRVPLRVVELLSAVGGDGAGAKRSAGQFEFLPTIPAQRSDSVGGVLHVEYTLGTPDDRWSDLTATLPAQTEHALVVEVRTDGAPFRAVYPVQPNKTITVGGTGYAITVDELLPEPPMPIITPGYEGGRSSVAIVRVTPPGGSGAYSRWIYARYPEISQDLLDEKNENGMPRRRNADPAIRITYIDASQTQVLLDERPGPDGAGTVRALIRGRGGAHRVIDQVAPGGEVEIAPMVGLRLGSRTAHAVAAEFPVPVPQEKRDTQQIGTHRHAAVAIEVSIKGSPGPSPVVWLPFAQYMRVSKELERSVTLPDGRTVNLMFGRKFLPFPGFSVQLADFEMFPYPHSETPRDYRSDLVVTTRWNDAVGTLRRPTSLNEPLLLGVPFLKNGDAPWLANALARAVSVVAPNEYKFSQSGWDATGWSETRKLVESGRLKQPIVRFTILGVGNNPGINVIATGAVMMGLGIPWAFYIKPLIMRRRKHAIQKSLAAERAGQHAGKPPQSAPEPPVAAGV